MNAETSAWDYSQVPQRQWEWQTDEHTVRSIRVHDGGLHYWQDDFSGLHGAGFQTFSQFLSDGPLLGGHGQELPSEAAAEVRTHILQHRTAGAARLIVILDARAAHSPVQKIDLDLDDRRVRTASLSEQPASAERVVLCNVALSSAETHSARWVVDFAHLDDHPAGNWLRGSCSFIPERGKSHTLRLVAGDGQVLAYWGRRALATTDEWRYDPETGLMDSVGVPRSLDLHDIPEERRVYSNDRKRVASLYVAFTREERQETTTDYEVKVWDAETGDELLTEIRRYSLDHTTNSRHGLPVRSVAFSKDAQALLVTLGLRGRYSTGGIEKTERIPIPPAS